MLKYAMIINEETNECNVGIGTNVQFYISLGMKELDVDLSEKDNKWYLSEYCPHYTEEELKQIEAERIANLTCTKRVLVMMLEELGLDYYEQIEPLIKNNRDARLQWELCEKLERKNELLDVIGLQLGISSEQLDRLFKYANGEVDTLKEVDNG